MAFKPYEGSVELMSVSYADLAEMIPDMIKNRMATRQASRLKSLVNFLKTGTKPGGD